MNPIDFSKKANWCKLPEITKEFDTLYVYATEYILGSMAELLERDFINNGIATFPCRISWAPLNWARR